MTSEAEGSPRRCGGDLRQRRLTLAPRPLTGITGVETQDFTNNSNSAVDAGDDDGNDATGVEDAWDDDEVPTDDEILEGNDLSAEKEHLFQEARLAGFTIGEAELYVLGANSSRNMSYTSTQRF